jgi:hypothetical protein
VIRICLERRGVIAWLEIAIDRSPWNKNKFVESENENENENGNGNGNGKPFVWTFVSSIDNNEEMEIVSGMRSAGPWWWDIQA